MKINVVLLCVALSLFVGRANAQWVVSDPGNLAQGIINTAKEIVETSKAVNNTLDTFKETKKLYDQGKEYYDALKSVSNLVKDARKVQKTILMVGEISEIYVTNFQLMLTDVNFRPEELSAIAFGYSKLLEESADILDELKGVVNVSSLSLSDAERIAIVDRSYNSVRKYRDLVSYYTRKTISVSYLRAKKANDTDRVMALYGGTNDRYW